MFGFFGVIFVVVFDGDCCVFDFDFEIFEVVLFDFVFWVFDEKYIIVLFEFCV